MHTHYVIVLHCTLRLRRQCRRRHATLAAAAAAHASATAIDPKMIAEALHLRCLSVHPQTETL